MAAAVETGFKPNPHDTQCQVFSYHTLTDREHISIIMLARKASRLFVPTKRATHAVHFVRHHRFAIARTTEYDASFAFAACYCFRCRPNEKRIIHRFFTERAEVFHLVPQRAEQ